MLSKRPRGKRLYRLKGRVISEKGIKCRSCGAIDIKNELDHITPLSKGGTNELENLQILCQACHKRKTAQQKRKLGSIHCKHGYRIDENAGSWHCPHCETVKWQ